MSELQDMFESSTRALRKVIFHSSNLPGQLSRGTSGAFIGSHCRTVAASEGFW